jgi:phage-related protein
MRAIEYVRPCLTILQEFPDEVRSIFAHALMLASQDARHIEAAALDHIPGTSAVELAVRNGGRTCRLVYTLDFPAMVYVIHASQKPTPAGRLIHGAEIKLMTAQVKSVRAMRKKEGKQR